MAGHHHNNPQLSEMDRFQGRNRPHNESLLLGCEPFVHSGGDPPVRVGSSDYGSMALRSNDLPSSSYITQHPGPHVGNPGTTHSSHVHFTPAGSFASYLSHHSQSVPALSYPHRSDEGFAPVSSQVDNRRVALKRKNPATYPMDGINSGGYYAGSSSNPQFSNHMQPNSIPLSESCHPQIPVNIGPSNWNDHHSVNHEGSQRNVRGRHDHAIPLEPTPPAPYASNGIHLPPLSNSSAPSLSTPVMWNLAPLPVPPRIASAGSSGSTSIALRERPYYPALQSNNLSGPVPTLRGPSDSALFTHGSYAPRAVRNDTVPSYPPPAFAATSSSRAASHEAAIPSYLPGTSAVTSTSLRIGHSFPRHVSTAHGSSGRSRRSRNSYHGLHPWMLEAERFMMLDQLVFYESREASDPHRDMRLDIDDMSYEELLALEEWIGNVDAGLANEKISGCVTEVVCCCSDHTQNDQEDGSCVICLEEYKDKDSLGRLKCGHDFHANCIKKWLQVKNSCPVCKAAAAEDSRGSK